MNWTKSIVAGMLGCLQLGGALHCRADANADKYNAISVRNAFNLRAPEPPKPPEPPPPPTTTVKLTGITTILSSRRALLLVTEAGKPPESRIMREGDREGQIEVLAIDVDAKTVKINNTGKEVTLNFDRDGIKPTSAPAAPALPPGVVMSPPGTPGAPGVPGNPGMNPGMPVNPGIVQPGFPQPAVNPQPTVANPAPFVRPLRTPGVKY